MDQMTRLAFAGLEVGPAVPLKATIALTGVTFSYLLSAFGKDVAEPLGVQLSILAVSVASFIGFFAFSRYPEKEVQKWLE